MKKIFIIYTGGTIGMVNSPKCGLIPFDFQQIKENVPELERFNYHFEVNSFNPIIDSSNVNTKHWEKLALLIQHRYDDFDGFVILHGSDTMAYTASALSFMLENLQKPVVLTGSQLPIGEIRTDAKENLITAIEIAAHKTNGKATIPEVCIYFDYYLFRGNRAVKYNTDKFEAFQSPNYMPLAEAGVNLNFNHKYILHQNNKSPKSLHTQMTLDTAISVLKIFPGISKSSVEAILNAPVKAIILESFGSGNMPTEKWFLDLLKKAIHDGKYVVDITQCLAGSVNLGKYETSAQLLEIGIINGYDLTFEACLTKLMYLLPQKLSKNSFKKKMESSLRGELTEPEIIN